MNTDFMNEKILSPCKVGLAAGALLGAFHLLWALLVLTGWAQPLMDFLFWLHFLKPVYVITPFVWVRALGLVGVTGMFGFAMGGGFALCWNVLHRRKS